MISLYFLLKLINGDKNFTNTCYYHIIKTAKHAPFLKASLEFRHDRLGYKHYEAMSSFISVHEQNTTKPNHEYTTAKPNCV